jgi:hypothetical protein
MSEETYFRERTTLIDMEQKSADQHDKAILTLTAGALGLSITFLDKIAANPLPETLFLVGLSWSLFILAIMCIVLSFLTSQSACRHQRELIDVEYSTGNIPDDNNLPANLTWYLNLGSYVLFVAGVIFLALFSWLNLPTGDKAEMTRSNETALIGVEVGNLANASHARPSTNPIGDGRGANPPRRPATPKPNIDTSTPPPKPKK